MGSIHRIPPRVVAEADDLHSHPAEWASFVHHAWHDLKTTGDLPDTPVWHYLESLHDAHPHRFDAHHPCLAHLFRYRTSHPHHAVSSAPPAMPPNPPPVAQGVSEPSSGVLLCVGISLLAGLAVEAGMTFGSLFAGIGGFDLGLERAGMECKWQVEIDPYATRVLAKHWPLVRRHDDVRTFPPPDGDWGVDLICGGFPCQDISFAGKGAGLSGERSGLWKEYRRVIGTLRPRYVLIENVAAITFRGLGCVLSDLAEIGFDAEWESIQAASFGAPHLRERIFILAYPDSFGLEANAFEGGLCKQAFADTWDHGHCFADGGKTMVPLPIDGSEMVSESLALGVASRIPESVDRLRCLGNAVVPQVAEWIGRQIMEADIS